MSGIRGRLARIDEIARGVDRFATKTITFTGAAGAGEAGTNVTVFRVTGQVLIEYIIPFCTVELTEAAATATISLGIVGSGSLFIDSTNSNIIDVSEFWVVGGSSTPLGVGLSSATGIRQVVVMENVIVVCAGQNTNGGALRFDVFWRPLSADGNLEPA